MVVIQRKRSSFLCGRYQHIKNLHDKQNPRIIRISALAKKSVNMQSARGIAVLWDYQRIHSYVRLEHLAKKGTMDGHVARARAAAEQRDSPVFRLACNTTQTKG